MNGTVIALAAFCAASAGGVEVTRLDNGLRVVVVPDTRWAAVSVQMWYYAGSADDPPGRPGLVDLARRALTAAAKNAATGKFESYTLPDACAFVWFVRPQELEAALQAEARRAAIEAVSAGQVSAVIADGPPQQRGWVCTAEEAAVAAAAFEGHPYTASVRTWSETPAVAPEPLNELIQTRFVPANATLLIVGKVSPAEALEAVRRHFGPLLWRQAPDRPRRPVPEGTCVVLEPMSSRWSGLTVGWVTPGAAGGDWSAQAVLMHALCNPVDGVLYQAVLAAGAMPPVWKMLPGRDAGLLLLSIDIEKEPATRPSGDPPDAARLRIILDRCMEEAESRPLSEVALTRARSLARRDLLLIRSSFRSWSWHLGFVEVVGGDLTWAEWELAAVESVGARDVQRAAAELRRSRCAILPRVAGASAAPASCDAGEPRVAGSSPVAVDRRQGTFDSRVSYVIDYTPAVEVAEVTTAVGPVELATALRCLLGVGSKPHPIEQLRDYLSYRGIDLFVVTQGKRAAFRSRGPGTTVLQMLELQAELLQHPARDSHVVEQAAEQARRIEGWLAAGWRPGSASEWYLPPGFAGWQLGARLPADASEFARSLEALGGCKQVEIWIRGDVEADAVERQIEQLWGGSPQTAPSGP